MDPIKKGKEIFLEIASRWNGDKIQDPKDVQEFFRCLRKHTKGRVIFDFLDTGSWDRFVGHDYNLKTSSLFLYWHDYRRTDPIETENRKMSQLVFPGSLYGLYMHLQEIRILREKKTAVFLLKGFSLTAKEIKKRLNSNSEEFDLKQKNLFSATVFRKIDGLWQIFEVHKAQLYTTVILPKNLGIPSFDSRLLLFEVNLVSVIDRLRSAHLRLNELDDSAVDEICEKSNTVRRVLEHGLKIEICYREIQTKKPYSQLLLGDLLKTLRPFHNDEMRKIFRKISEWAHEFSHDSGKPVDRRKASTLALLGIGYVELLKSSIHLNPFFGHG